jgi:hypothetical protein
MLASMVNLSMIDTPPKNCVYSDKPVHYASSSDFNVLRVVREPGQFKFGVSMYVQVTHLVLKYEFALDDKPLVNSLSKKKKYTPFMIKAYRLFWIVPSSPLFMCMENGKYAVVPGYCYKKNRKIVCIHSTEENFIHVHCMACLTKFCVICMNGVVYQTCPCCMYECFGCKSNSIFKKVLHSVY